MTYCRQAHGRVARYTDWSNISHCSPAPKKPEKRFPSVKQTDIHLTVRGDNKSSLITEDREKKQREKILVKYCNKENTEKEKEII